MEKDDKLWHLRLLWRPVSLALIVFILVTQTVRRNVMLHLSHHYSFSGPSFTVPFITKLGTEQLCLLPSALLFSQFHSAGEQTSPWVSWWEGPEHDEVAGTREGGSPLCRFPGTRSGATGERQEELRGLPLFLSPLLSPEVNTVVKKMHYF